MALEADYSSVCRLFMCWSRRALEAYCLRLV
jgi:hypothetical protein